MDEKTKMMLVETAGAKSVLVNAGIEHPFDVVDGHLILLNYKGYPTASFVPGSWVAVVDYPLTAPNEGE